MTRRQEAQDQERRTHLQLLRQIRHRHGDLPSEVLEAGARWMAADGGLEADQAFTSALLLHLVE